jgi:Rrf2 family protein
MVNQQFTFALHILTCLAFSGRIIDSRTLAASVNTNPVVVRRLLLALRRAGLIETFPGKHGGTKLRCAPNRISLRQIYDAVEPPRVIAVSERQAWKQCTVSCNMKRIMTSISREADNVLREHLRRSSLQDVLREVVRRA